MNINGTVTAFGTANVTAAVTMGNGGILNLTNTGFGNDVTASRVTGAIDGYKGRNGTLNVNGTWTTVGTIGNVTNSLSAVNLDNNATAATYHD